MMRLRCISTVIMMAYFECRFVLLSSLYISFQNSTSMVNEAFWIGLKVANTRQVMYGRQHAPSIICTERTTSYQRWMPPVPCASSAAWGEKASCTTLMKLSSTKVPCTPSSGEPDLVGVQMSTNGCVGGDGPGVTTMRLFPLNLALTTSHWAQGEHTIRSQQALITSALHHHRAPHAQGCLPRALLMLTTCHTPHTIHRAPAGPLFKKEGMLLRPMAQLYEQVRTDWNQCFVIDCSLSHPAGHKPFTCSHSVLRNT